MTRKGIRLNKSYLNKMFKHTTVSLGEKYLLQWNLPQSRPSAWRWWTSRHELDNDRMHEWAHGWPLCSYGPDYRYYSGTKQSKKHQNEESSVISKIYSHFVDSIFSPTWVGSTAWKASPTLSTQHPPLHQGSVFTIHAPWSLPNG